MTSAPENIRYLWFNSSWKLFFFFQTNPCQHPIVILRDITEDDLNCILKFMYHGEVQVAEEHLQEFLKTAETLQVRGLAEGSATPVLLADEASIEVSEEERLMLRRRRLMHRRRANNDSNDEAVDPIESQKTHSSVRVKICQTNSWLSSESSLLSYEYFE